MLACAPSSRHGFGAVDGASNEASSRCLRCVFGLLLNGLCMPVLNVLEVSGVLSHSFRGDLRKTQFGHCCGSLCIFYCCGCATFCARTRSGHKSCFKNYN